MNAGPRRRARDHEQGSLILDVLIGMAIFALIAAIATSGVSAYRARAYEHGAMSDASSLAMAAEADSANGYPAALDAAALSALGVTLSPGNTIGGYVADADSFALCVEHDNGGKDAYAVYDSARGGITAQGRTGGCSGVTLDASASSGSSPTPPPSPFPGLPIIPARVVAWGGNSAGQTNVPGGLTAATQAVGGWDFSIALKPDGSVVGWGANGFGQTTIPAAAQSGVAQIATGDRHAVALKSDGSVVAWGINNTGQTSVPAGLTGVTRIASGCNHVLALKSDASVVAWGRNTDGQASVPAAAQHDVVQVAAGNRHSLALKSDGTVVAWGDDTAGESTVPAGLSGVVQVAAGFDVSYALKADGTIVSWGDSSNNRRNIPVGLTNVVQITAGYYNGFALKSNGTVVYWGTYAPANPPASTTGALGLGLSTCNLHALAIVP